MAWTAPATAVAGTGLTAAWLNTNVRDNMLETAAATATAAGDIIYADGANSMGSRLAIGGARSILISDGGVPKWRTVVSAAGNSTAFTLTATSFTDLDALGGEAISVTTTTGTAALVMMHARVSNATAGSLTYVSYSISGATTAAAGVGKALYFESSSANDVAAFGYADYVALTTGVNTFELQGQVNAGTGTIQYTEITVVPL